MSNAVHYRPFEPEDLPRALETLKAALGEPPGLERTPELFSWKHLDNPFGRSVMLVAEADKQIAGFRAFMRWDLRTPAGETIRCGRAVDTATHPDFQRMGIFSRLTTTALEAARDAGIQLIFNTPNHRSGAGYLKMGWVEVGTIGAMVRPHLRVLSPSSVEDPVADRVSTFSIVDREPLGLRTRRTRDYLRWRYRQHPTARYFQISTGGSVAFVRPNLRRGRSELAISDLLSEHPRRVLAAVRRASRSGYDAVWFSRNTPERKAALLSGFVPVPTRTLTLMARPLADLSIDVADMASWDISVGDLELL